MKTVTAKNQSLTVEENIHNALKREYLYAECLNEVKQLYSCGNRGLGEIVWEKDWACELAINTNDGKCYIAFYN